MATIAPTTPNALITDQLNAEWHLMSAQRAPDSWKLPTVPDHDSLGGVATSIAAARLSNPAGADSALLALLDRHQNHSDQIAGRIVLQIMLGRAVNLVRRTYRAGASGVRGNRAQLASASVTALWTAIATYPVERRRQKVSVNLCMDALGYFTDSLDERAPATVDHRTLENLEPFFIRYTSAADELLGVLAWGIQNQAISRDDASLLSAVYCPGPGREGGAPAVATQLGLEPATVRQRCHRATQRLADAIHTSRDLDLCRP